MTTKEVSQLLGGTEHVRKVKGQFKYWQSYYWGFTKSADKLIEKVKATIPQAVITDSGNHYHDFVGGAKSGSGKDSYLWVTFTVPVVSRNGSAEPCADCSVQSNDIHSTDCQGGQHVLTEA